MRSAAPEDLASIWALVCELAHFERLEHQVTGSSDALERDLFGEAPRVESIVADEDGVVVGYSLFFATYSTFRTCPGLWMEDLYVTPSHRGRGIGKALFLEVVRIADARGCARCEWSVLDWNRGAIEFYQAHGATLLPDWTTCRLDGDALRNLAQPPEP